MRTFWLTFEHFAGILFLFGLAAPFVFALIGVKAEGRRAAPGAVRHFGFLSCGGFALGSLLGLWILMEVRCAPPPGMGSKAQAGYAASAPLLVGLEHYHADHAAYPSELSALVPGYLSSSQLPIGDGAGLPSEGFEYRPDGEGFELTFRYGGPGMNRCTFASRSGRWSCSGYY